MEKNKETLHDLFILKLKALYDIETELIKALPKMAKKAAHPELKLGFEEHLRQTEEHKKRLERIFVMMDEKPAKTKVESIRGLAEDNEWLVKKIKSPEVLDAALIAGGQYAEHLEIAGYGTAKTWAELMGHTDAADLLARTLKEEEETNEKLTSLAEGGINQAAMSEGRMGEM